MRFIVAISLFALFHGPVHACDCGWVGPFFTVAKHSELIVHGRVLGYHGRERGVRLAMDIQVLNVLNGSTEGKVIRVWGDNGALCRPYVSSFPKGTEWIFALDGQGAKIGSTKERYTISICGEYWLKVEGGNIVGHIDESKQASPQKKMAVGDFQKKLCEVLKNFR